MRAGIRSNSTWLTSPDEPMVTTLSSIKYPLPPWLLPEGNTLQAACHRFAVSKLKRRRAGSETVTNIQAAHIAQYRDQLHLYACRHKLCGDIADANPCKLQSAESLFLRQAILRRGAATRVQIVPASTEVIHPCQHISITRPS